MNVRLKLFKRIFHSILIKIDDIWPDCQITELINWKNALSKNLDFFDVQFTNNHLSNWANDYPQIGCQQKIGKVRKKEEFWTSLRPIACKTTRLGCAFLEKLLFFSFVKMVDWEAVISMTEYNNVREFS